MSKCSDAFVLEISAGAVGPDRRELLARLLAMALADAMFWPRGGATAEALPLGRDRFLALSAKLCAMQIKNEALADAIQNALVGRFAANELKHIANILEIGFSPRRRSADLRLRTPRSRQIHCFRVVFRAGRRW